MFDRGAVLCTTLASARAGRPEVAGEGRQDAMARVGRLRSALRAALAGTPS